MSYLGTDASLVVPISLELDVDVDNDGISYFVGSLVRWFVGSLFVGDDEKDQDIKVETDQVIGSLSDFHGDIDGYQHLYIDAHVLTRMAEVVRKQAGMAEESITATSDLFDSDILP